MRRSLNRRSEQGPTSLFRLLPTTQNDDMTERRVAEDSSETPWEFLPGDDEVDTYDDNGPGPEERALHVERKRKRRLVGDADRQTVHYLDDEEPELPDRSVRRRKDTDTTAEVEELLIRQHYLDDDD